MSQNAANNAGLRRHDPSVEAEDARRVLADPAVTAAFERMEKACVDALALAQSDGSPEFQQQQDETVRTLRTIRRLRMGMGIKTQLDDLRAAGFKPVDLEAETTDEANQHGI